MNKRLNVEGMMDELKQGSSFFKHPTPPLPEPDSKTEKELLIEKRGSEPNNEASTLSSYQASTIEPIRKIVKILGKEVSYLRLTEKEKDSLADIVYTYNKKKKIRTSENEINRIAINYVLNDFKDRGEESILARVISAINA